MAISWAQGLLAGASGIAEYSNQEQARRQKRIDRTHELKNMMRMEHAKSAYASKVASYERNKKVLDSIKGLEAGGFHEQSALFRAQNYDAKTASALATRVKKGKLKALSRPKAITLPEFEMPEVSQGQASSPLQDWARGFRQSYEDKSQTEMETPEETIQRVSTEELEEPNIPGVHPSPSEFGQATALSAVIDENFEDPMAPPKEYQTAVWKTEVGTDGKEYQVPYYQEKGTTTMVKGDPVSPTSVKVDYKTTEQKTSRKGKAGILMQGVNPNDPTDTWEKWLPSGSSGYTNMPLLVEALPDGSEQTTERYMDPETNEILEGDIWISKKGEGNRPLRTQSFAEYMNPGSDTAAKGRFFADYPKPERDTWIKWGEKDEGFWSREGNDMPADLPERMGAEMLDQMNLIRSKLGPDVASNPNKQSFIKDYAKARTYLKVLGQDTVIWMIENGELPKELFYSPYANQAASVKKLHEALGISDPKSKDYRALTNYNNEDQFGELWKARATAF